MSTAKSTRELSRGRTGWVAKWAPFCIGSAAMSNRLYVIPASHPSIAAELMLQHKGIAYKRTDLLPVISKGVLRTVGFPGVTVPALKIDGDKVQGSRQITRELDRLRPA